MRFLILLLFSLSLHGHSSIHVDENKKKTISYGIYADLAYRDKDLYPKGIEGSVGYENHGSVEKFELNHIGAFIDGVYNENFYYALEFNRHVNAQKSFDSYLEKAYIGYGSSFYKVLVGRGYNNISFVNQKPWGYGFAKMPLSVDSFFDGTYIADGIFLEYKNMGLKANFDLTQDKYYGTQRATIKLTYKIDRLKLISYFQTRKKSKLRVDFSSTDHSHSHGDTDGCENLDTQERCFERDNKVFGFGINSFIENVELQSEYIYLETKGDVSSSDYKVKSSNKIHTLYLQAVTNYNDILFGLRSEWFSFENTYNGSGASDVAKVIVSDNSDTVQNLQTLLIGYRFNKYNKLISQAEHSENGWAGRLNYSVNFSLSK